MPVFTEDPEGAATALSHVSAPGRRRAPGPGGFRGRIRCARGRCSARCGRSRSKRPEPGRFRGADRARVRGSGQCPPEAPELSFPEFPEPPAEAAQPRIPSPAHAKIARGRISTSQRADQAGQRGSSPRPTAEGPGSGRAPSPAGLQAPLSCTLPPYVLLPGHHRWVVSPKLKLQRRGWNFLGSSPPQLCSLGMGIQKLWIEGRWGLAPSPPSVNTETAGLWQLLPKTPLRGAPRPRGVARAEPEATARCLEAGRLLAGVLGRWRDPSSEGQGVGAGCRTCWGHVCGEWAGGPQPCLPEAQMLLTRVPYVCTARGCVHVCVSGWAGPGSGGPLALC
ncbi:uncharacterized protein LOC132232558 [Myotis daubentonii]|uniref:uncharacterized protein LOC132232558 n=1 Tax=Myotis daubentonii TaxID=98922 RepID=UPI002872F3B7|nr:uncharacterized protein LOC132232558 [Myotis daubentonii]